MNILILAVYFYKIIYKSDFILKKIPYVIFLKKLFLKLVLKYFNLNNINYFENVDDVIYYFEKPWKFIDEINVAIFSLLVEDRKMNLDYFENKELLNEIENLVVKMEVDFPTINKEYFNEMLYEYY